jgi:hypothetical protein
MDPLSILAAASSVTAGCLKAMTTLNDLQTRFKNANLTITLISSKSALVAAWLSQLQRLCEDPHSSFVRNMVSQADLVVALDTSLTGCTMVYTYLNKELGSLSRNINSGTSSLDVMKKFKLLWKQDTMNNILQQITHQETAISCLIQCVQM